MVNAKWHEIYQVHQNYCAKQVYWYIIKITTSGRVNDYISACVLFTVILFTDPCENNSPVTSQMSRGPVNMWIESLL